MVSAALTVWVARADRRDRASMDRDRGQSVPWATTAPAQLGGLRRLPAEPQGATRGRARLVGLAVEVTGK
jgi:hypothetical protein